MDFEELQRKNAQKREQYKPRSMKTDSENEFIYGIVFVVGFIVLFGIYSAKRDQINKFFNREKSFVENIFDDSDDERQRQANKEKQRQEYIESQQRNNVNDKGDKNSDGYDRIIFDNKSKDERKVYWLSRKGDKSLYKTLKPGESYEQRAYSHHQWLVTDKKGKELGTYFSKGAKSSIVMYDDKISHIVTSGTYSVQNEENDGVTERLLLDYSATNIKDYRSNGTVDVLVNMGELKKHDAYQYDEEKKPSFKRKFVNGKDAIIFDGVDDMLRIKDHNLLNTGNSYNARSISMLFKAGSDINSRQVVFEEGGAANGFNIYIDGGRLYFGAWSKSKGWDFKSVSSKIEANTIYDTTFVIDGSAKKIWAYVNGDKIGEADGIGVMNKHTDDIAIGGQNGQSLFHDFKYKDEGYFFNGALVELKMYDHALSMDKLTNANDNSDKDVAVGTQVEQQDNNRASKESIYASTVTFINKSSDVKKIYWLNFQGEKILYKKLNPNDSYKQATFLTHPWLVSDKDDSEIGVFYPKSKKSYVTIYANSAEHSLSEPKVEESLSDEVREIIGSYQRRPYENNWHNVNVIYKNGNLVWTNEAGHSWTLYQNGKNLRTDKKCPYGVKDVLVERGANNIVSSLFFLNEKYYKQY